jgi:hypothetical protein
MSLLKKVCKYKMGDQPKESFYWQNKSYQERLSALEGIRTEYNSWRYNAEQRLQRVYRIIKQT